MISSIAILNPNSTVAMTEDMVAIARTVAPPGCRIVGMTNSDGPPAIQGEADAKACLPGLFALAKRPEARDADALVIGCFDDTGLQEMRAQSSRPVLGLGEAGMLTATLAATRFAVLTTTQGSVSVIARNMKALSLGHRCDEIRAAHVPVLDLEARVADLRAALASLVADTATGAVVLGCAGMGRLAGDLAAPGLPPLIDPVRAAITLAASVVDASFTVGEPGLSGT